MLTQVRLKERLHYETETGKWLWLIRKGKCLPGSAAGSNDLDGYLLIQIDGKLYRANRLAFLYVKGSWPRHKADHIDGDPTNCKWNNLQDITQAHNCLKKRTPVTNKSGYRGVSFHKASGQWKAKFRNDELGIRRTREAAAELVEIARKNYISTADLIEKDKAVILTIPEKQSTIIHERAALLPFD